jgi:hypothetical protein
MNYQQKPPVRVEGFVCPSCGGTSYETIDVPRAFEEAVETGLFRCSACNFGFLSPQRYARQGTGRRD